MIDKRIADFQA